MSEGSVNVESRTSSQDKRWTIMAALLGTNTAVMLFQGIEQEANPTQMREVALAIIAGTLPFQGVYFLIYTFLLENKGTLSEKMVKKLGFASAICQIFGYVSLVGVAMMWYNLSVYVGGTNLFHFITAISSPSYLIIPNLTLSFIVSDVRKSVSCVEAKTGKILWSTDTPGFNVCWGSPTIADAVTATIRAAASSAYPRTAVATS